MLAAASCTLLFPAMIYAFDDKITHPDITDVAIYNSDIKTYLLSYLGFDKGTESKVKNGSISQWIRLGSELEDSPVCRASNHFHNPLLPWDESHVSDFPLMAAYCVPSGWVSRYSNVTWATGFVSPESSLPSFSRLRQTMGWDNARSYFFHALTAKQNAEREAFFAKTFQAVGQTMHLLEDMAVPAHVRNDFRGHLVPGAGNPVGNRFEFFVKMNPSLVDQATSLSPSWPNPRLTDFWDSDIYDGTNPSDRLDIGLAEYTNANFFSESNIFREHPRPRREDTNYLTAINNPTQVYAEDGRFDSRVYIKATGTGGSNHRLAAFRTSATTVSRAVIMNIRLSSSMRKYIQTMPPSSFLAQSATPPAFWTTSSAAPSRFPLPTGSPTASPMRALSRSSSPG